MVDPGKEIVYGAMAGCLGKLIEFPFDTVKVRLQTTHGSSTVGVTKQILRKEGIFSFYKGIKAPVVGACLESAVLFSAFQYGQQAVRTFTPLLTESMASVCISGAFSGLAASFVLTPVELVKCNMQVSNLVSNSKVAPATYSSVIRQVLKTDGFSGLWHGLSSTLVREMAGTAVWFASYEEALRVYNRINPGRENMNLLASGATAGFMFNLSIYPVDTIKSNVQTSQAMKLMAKTDFISVIALLVSKPGGVRNLYSGLGITLVRSIPANAVIFYTYEWLKKSDLI